MYVRESVCLHEYVYVYKFACLSVWVCECVFVWVCLADFVWEVCVKVNVWVCMREWVCEYAFVSVYVCVCVSVRVCEYSRASTYVFARTLDLDFEQINIWNSVGQSSETHKIHFIVSSQLEWIFLINMFRSTQYYV